MSETDPRPMNQPTSADSVQLPAIPQPAPGTLGMPLPASPWIDGGEGSSGFNFTSFLHSLRRTWLSGLGIGFLIATTLAGLLCDGAKESCAYKLSAATSTAIQSAYLALEGAHIPAGGGIVGNTIEETFENLGRLNNPGMVETDRFVLQLIQQVQAGRLD